MKNVAIYMRVSSDKQAKEGDSIPAQRAALVKYVNDRPDMVLAGEYIDDGVSGQKVQRDELQRLLDDVKEKKIDVILFTKLDRWFRSVRHYTATQEVLDKYGVTWAAIWEPIYDTTTPAGRLIVNQMMSIAQFEAENTGQRIRQVQAYKVQQGEVISGSVPVGYSIQGKHMIPNADAPDVLAAFQHFSETSNLRDTVRFCTGTALPRAVPSMKRVLMNRKYIGEHRGNASFCPPIVPRELFEDVQRKLSMNIKSNQKRVYIFSGLLRCAECGKSMSACFRVKYKNHPRWNPQETAYYRCTDHYAPGGTCPNSKTLHQTTLEKYLLANIRPLIKGLMLDYEVQQKPKRNTQKQVSAIEARMARLKELFLNGLLTLDQYKKDIEQARNEISRLTAVNAPSPPDLSGLNKLLTMDIEGLYATFTDEEKRFFWRSVIREITFSINRDINVTFL